MSDQDGEKTAAEKTESGSQTSPEKVPEAPQAKPTAGEAPREIGETEVGSEPPEHEEDIEDSELEADPEPPEETETHSSGTAEPPPEKAKRRGGFLKLVAYLIALSLAGGGGYYLWNAYFATPDSAESDTALTPPEPPSPAPEQKAEVEKTAPAPETAAAPQTPPENSDSQSRTAPPPAAAPQTAASPPAAAESPKPAETEKLTLAAEPSPQALATKPASESAASEQKPVAAPVAKVQGEGTAPANGAVSQSKPAAGPSEMAPIASASESAKPAEAGPLAPAPVEATKPAAAQVETNAASEAAANPQTTAALAAISEKVAAADATIETLSQRLQTVENQLGALKSAPRAAPAASEPAARLAVAQSLLNAMRQGDDYSAQIAAMQNLGADPEQLARLRAGLSAPGVEALAKEFAALAPKLVEASAPAKRTEPAKPPRNLKDAIWAQVEMEANKLVRIRPAGSAEQDAAAATVATIEKNLRAGDLSGALAERQQLAPAARSLSDQWAASVQTRIEAESAAKAALNAALRNLTKPKT